MTPLISCLIFGGVLAVVTVFAVGLIALFTEKPAAVVEDTGDYE